MKKQMTEFDTYLGNNPKYYLGFDIEDEFCPLLAQYTPDKVFLVEDEFVGTVTNSSLYHKIRKQFACTKIRMVTGEANKTFPALSNLCEALLRSGVTRDSVVIAHGGGMVGNIAGLAAALLFRGIRFVEVPTTFLAQTDSVLSNKQAVNSTVGKNHFGVYYAPLFIFSDVKYLTSDIPKRIKNGLVETIKNALISDCALISQLKQNLRPDGCYTDSQLYDIVEMSILSKLKILKKDPGERTYGVILEYGHTIGHAIEKLSNDQVLHGEAVAAGMLAAGFISQKLGLLNKEDVMLMRELIVDIGGIKIEIPEGISNDEILKTIRTDNKKTAKGIRYVLLDNIGSVYNPNGDYMVSLDEEMVRQALAEIRAR